MRSSWLLSLVAVLTAAVVSVPLASPRAPAPADLSGSEVDRSPEDVAHRGSPATSPVPDDEPRRRPVSLDGCTALRKQATLDLFLMRPGGLPPSLSALVEVFPSKALISPPGDEVCRDGRMRIVVAAPARIARVLVIDRASGSRWRLPIDVALRPGMVHRHRAELPADRSLVLEVRDPNGRVVAGCERVAVSWSGAGLADSAWSVPAGATGRLVLPAFEDPVHCEPGPMPGYAAHTAVRWDSQRDNAAVAAGLVAVVPSTPWRGRVVDPDGRAIPGAEVLLEPMWSPIPQPEVDGVRSALPRPLRGSADRDGAVRLTVGRGLSYGVRVRHRDYVEHTVDLVPGSEPQTISLSPGLVVDGVVVDEARNPLDGVSVQPLDPRLMRIRTDSAGRFSFRGVREGGSVTLRISKAGFASREVRLTGLAPSEHRARVTLAKGTVLSGFIVDESGDPVAGASVRLTPQRGVVVTCVTDDAGRFCTNELQSGRSRVEIARPEAGQFEFVGVADSGQRDVTWCVGGRSSAILRGRVFDPITGQVPSAFTVGVSRREGEVSLGEQIDVRDLLGRFELRGLRPGPVTLTVTAHGYPPIEMDRELDEGPTDVVVELSRGQDEQLRPEPR